MINFNQTSLKETWNKNVKSIKFDSFDVKATVTKKVAKKRYVIIEFVSCDFDEGKSQIFQNGSYPKTFRSSRPEVFCKKGIHRNFTKFTGKQLCQSLFFNKVAGLRPNACNFIKKRLWHRSFSVNFVKFLKHLFT